MSFNVPVVCDVPVDADRRSRVCALGWCFVSMSHIYLPCPPAGGAPTKKPKVRQCLGRGQAASRRRCAYNPVIRSTTSLTLFCYYLFSHAVNFSPIKCISLKNIINVEPIITQITIV